MVRRLEPGDVDEVVGAVAARFDADAQRQPLVNPDFSREGLAHAFTQSADATWVARDEGSLVGHLHGALLENADYGRGVWIGPDGASFDGVDTLAELYRVAGALWIAEGAREHYVWTLEDRDRLEPWYELGFARMHQRGVLVLEARNPVALTPGYSLRRGGPGDLELAVALDAELDAAQHEGPSFVIGDAHASAREDLRETLEDPDVHHYVVEYEGAGVAQCFTYPLAPIRGSYDDTVHLSAVAVRGAHRRCGVGRAMVDRALHDARAAGFTHAETNWRVTNRTAANFWRRYGFTTTYVRLHRTIGPH